MDKTDPAGRGPMRFLSFTNDEEELEKQTKFKEAAAKIEQALAQKKNLDELVDYVPPPEDSIDPANDTRSLYERLQEQKDKKKEAIEESHKLSNLVFRLDEDDASYLNEVALRNQQEELKKRLEVHDALEEKRRLAAEKLADEEQKLKRSLAGTMPTNKSSLKSKLAAKIRVRPRQHDHLGDPTKSDDQGTSQTIETESTTVNSATHQNQETSSTDEASHQNRAEGSSTSNTNLADTVEVVAEEEGETQRCNFQTAQCVSSQVARCIGILPAAIIAGSNLSNSSDSDRSDDEADIQTALRVCRRKRQRRS